MGGQVWWWGVRGGGTAASPPEAQRTYIRPPRSGRRSAVLAAAHCPAAPLGRAGGAPRSRRF
eukprot:scaffold26439_cov34-Isochrysis_galbana.AAC.1